jgi:hypothetical protein
MRMILGLSEPLSKLVATKYSHAKSAGSLVFADSETAIIPIHGGASVSSIYVNLVFYSHAVAVPTEILSIAS